MSFYDVFFMVCDKKWSFYSTFETQVVILRGVFRGHIHDLREIAFAPPRATERKVAAQNKYSIISKSEPYHARRMFREWSWGGGTLNMNDDW